MASEFGIDLGNVLAREQDIRAARIRNTLSQTALDRDNQAMAARQQAIGGDRAGGLNALAVLDPAQASQLQNYFGGLDDEKKAAVAAQTDEIGRAAAYVLSAQDPEMAYQQVRASVTPELQAKMPPTFDQGWVELQLAQASSIDDILKRAQPQAGAEPKVINGQLVAADGTIVGDYRDAPEASGPATNLGKLKADLDAGLITPEQYAAAVAKETALPNSQSTQLQVDPSTGAVTFTQGNSPAGGVSDMPKLTEGQSKDVNFLTRSSAANDTLANIDTELTSLIGRAGNMDPTGLTRQWTQSPAFQQAENAALEFKTAILRKDTGAAITEQEDAQYDRLYIPQPGDSQQLIEQKRDARKRAVDALAAGIPSAAIAGLEERGLLASVVDGAKTEDAEAASSDTASDQPDLTGPPTRTLNGVDYWNIGGNWYTK